MAEGHEKPKSRNIFLLWGPPLILSLIGSVLIFVSLAIKLGLSSPETFKEVGSGFLLELGLGFIVGAVIAMTIEKYTQDRKEKELSQQEERIRRNIFEALFETAIPREFVTEMYKALFEPKFLREHLEIAFGFRKLNAAEQAATPHTDLLVLTQTIRFNARNITDRPTNHEFNGREYALIDHPNFPTPFHDVFIKGSDKTFNLTINDILAQETRPDPFWHRLGPLNVMVAAKESAEICVVVEKVCRSTDTKTWITRHAANNLKVVIELADDALYNSMDFTVDQSHRVELKKNPSLVPTLRKHEWNLNSPILPFQGIIVHWRPKS